MFTTYPTVQGQVCRHQFVFALCQLYAGADFSYWPNVNQALIGIYCPSVSTSFGHITQQQVG